MALEVLMPQFEPDGQPGRVVEWLVSVGDPVRVGQGLVVVEGDKSLLELESYSAGVLLAQFVDAGQAARPHTVLGVVGEPGEAIDSWLERARIERANAPAPAN